MASRKGYVDPRVGKCQSRYWELLRALFEHGVIKLRKKDRHHCGAIIDARIPNSAFEAPDPIALATGQPVARINVDTNEPIFVSFVSS